MTTIRAGSIIPLLRRDTEVVGKSSILTLLPLATLFCLARPAHAQYDLGGPCQDSPAATIFAKISEARKAGSLDQVIDLEKASVRAGCRIEYRWHELVTVLLEARRPSEALQALQEMDARGFSLNPVRIAAEHPDVAKFMDSPTFKASPIGKKIEQLKQAADARRAQYREALTQLPSDRKPPDNYIAKGACPFECCQYRDWTVREDTDLVAAPDSARVVGKAKKGTHVTGLTGEVHLKPEPIIVLGGDLPKDTIAFVLDYIGEGFANVYSRGKITNVFLGVQDYCFQISESCWAETLVPPSERKDPVWWVKVRLPNGVTGWTDKPDHFGNKDSCG